MKKIIEFMVRRGILGNMLTLGVLTAGIIALLSMRREAFPKVDFDIIVITVPYPGASPQEVEKLLTIPLERELKGLEGIKEEGSTSIENRAALVITLDPNVKNKQKVIQDIKDAVDRAKIEFPDDAEEPIVSEVSTARTPVIELALAPAEGVTMSELELRAYAERLEEQLEVLPGVGAVKKRGYRDREFFVEVDPEKMTRYNISVEQVVNALAARNLNFPGGTITAEGKDFAIRTVKEFDKAPELNEVIIRSNDLGGAVRLSDIASVRDDFTKKNIMEKTNGRESITLIVLKKESADAISVVEKATAVSDKFKAETGGKLTIDGVNDLSYYVKRRLGVLSGNVAVGMTLVLLSLYFFLGFRIAFVVALGIPFSFAATFLLMQYADISINLISMFGLIIVSGMLVDDAVVVGENIFRLIESGVPPLRAASVGAYEMVVPVIGSVATTIVAFAPLMFVSGIFGKFVWALPAGVIIGLVASLIESFLILPGHVHYVTANQDPRKIVPGPDSIQSKLFRSLQSGYQPLLEWALKRRYMVMMITLIVLLSSFVLLGRVGFILFPKGGIEAFFLKVESPQGVSLDEMNFRMVRFEKMVGSLPGTELEDFVTRIGIHEEEPNDPFRKQGKNYAQIAIYLKPENARFAAGARGTDPIIAYLTARADIREPVMSVQTFRDGGEDRLLVVRNSDGAEITDITGKVVRSFSLPVDFLVGGGALRDGFLFLTGSSQIVQTDFSGKVTKKIQLKETGAPVLFRVAPAGDRAAAAFEKGNYCFLDTKEHECKKTGSLDGEITDLRFAPDGRLFATTTNGVLQAFAADGGKDFRINKGNPVELEYGKPVFSAKKGKLPRLQSVIVYGNELWVAGFDGSVRIYDAKSGDLKNQYITGERPLYMASPAPGGFWASRDESLLFYDMSKSAVTRETPALGVVHEISGGTAFASFKQVFLLGENAVVTSPGLKLFDKIEFKQAGGGPPVGSPVQVEIRGEEFNTLISLADKVKEKLQSVPGVFDIRDNWEEGKEEFRVEINEARAAMAGITVQQIASTIQAAFEGRVATKIKKSDEEIDIRVIFPEAMREKLSSLNRVMVRNTIGNLVPITQLASFRKYPGVTLIQHSDFRRTIFVKANLDETKTTSVQVNQKILPLLNELGQANPGYSLAAGGEYEDTNESMQNLLFLMLVAIFGIFAILVLLFGNLRQPRVVLTSIPLGFAGVIFAFLLHKMTVNPKLTFSFLAMMGVIGLAGVIVNSAIVLVDFINKLRKAGMNMHDAVMGACLTRLRPVFLTTFTTVLGLMPTAYGIGGNDPFLKPMALAMSWGLLFGTLVTLIVIPVYYTIWEDRGFVFHSVFSGKIREMEREAGLRS